MRRALGHCEGAVRVLPGGRVVLRAQHGRGHPYSTQRPACIHSPGQQLLFHVQSSQTGYSSFMPILSSAPAAAPGQPSGCARGADAAGSGFASQRGRCCCCWFWCHPSPAVSSSRAFPVCVGISGPGGLPFATPSLGHLPSWHCLPPCWDETRLSGSTGVLAAAEGSALGRCGEADDGAHLPSRQPVKNQASIYGLHFWLSCSPHAHHPHLVSHLYCQHDWPHGEPKEGIGLDLKDTFFARLALTHFSSRIRVAAGLAGHRQGGRSSRGAGEAEGSTATGRFKAHL